MENLSRTRNAGGRGVYDPPMRAAVIGAGSWGTAIACLASAGAEASLWARRAELAEMINAGRENPDYLPGFTLPEGVAATPRLEEALEGAGLVLVAVPSHGYRGVLEQAKGLIDPSTPVISLAKGIEEGTGLRMSQVTLEVLEGHDPGAAGALSGPNLAVEIMEGQPAAAVVAVGDREAARRIQRLFSSPRLRVYTNPDVIGVEAAGAAKNVMAIAAGAAAGLGFGMNTMAALITRGLAEITRLGVALGGQTLTFGGLAGVGDLIATCGSPRSRNNRVGRRLGEGGRIGEILAETNMVAEGVRTTRAVLDLAARLEVEMPISEAVGRILYEGETVGEALADLMGRSAKAEGHGIAPRLQPRP